ncbi:molybdopterin-binding protein [Neisseria zoodegmatis]|uniref:TOBE domain-containing protein n=1 Tax=Neisseria zoodegmatis TaxID=326523 RepID=UPI00350E48E8
MLQTSARNQFNGVVKSVTKGAVNSEVIVELNGGQEITASVTCESVDALELAAGKEVIALVKSTNIIIATGLDGIRLSARNQLKGVISHIDIGAVNSVIELDAGNGITVSAGITVKSTEALHLKTGQEAVALFKAGAVILGVKA